MREPLAIILYRLAGETEEDALKATGFIPQSGDSVRFWDFPGDSLPVEKRVVDARHILGVPSGVQSNGR